MGNHPTAYTSSQLPNTATRSGCGVTPTPSSTPIHVGSPVYPPYGGTATAAGGGGGGGGGPGPIRPRRWRRRRGRRMNNKQASKQQIVS